MKTKALLIAAATLVAGVVSTEAQVYSENIVGYVNQPLLANFNALANPLDNPTGNSITNLIQNPIIPAFGGGYFDGSYVYIWNGTSYNIYQFDSSFDTGIADASDTYPLPPPIINPGTGFFFNSANTNTTNTFIGQVHIGSGTYPGTSTNTLPSSPVESFVSSVLPIGGGISSVLGLTNPSPGGPGNGPLDGTYLYLPVISGTGHFSGYNIVQFDSTQTTGFANAADTGSVPEPVIPVGGSFLINNQSGAPISWVQSIGQ
jgi:hypothetical protein